MAFAIQLFKTCTHISRCPTYSKIKSVKVAKPLRTTALPSILHFRFTQCWFMMLWNVEKIKHTSDLWSLSLVAKLPPVGKKKKKKSSKVFYHMLSKNSNWWSCQQIQESRSAATRDTNNTQRIPLLDLTGPKSVDTLLSSHDIIQ